MFEDARLLAKVLFICVADLSAENLGGAEIAASFATASRWRHRSPTAGADHQRTSFPPPIPGQTSCRPVSFRDGGVPAVAFPKKAHRCRPAGKGG